MKRDYDSGVSDESVYFVGTEVENTAQKGKQTLFVPFYEIDSIRILEIVRQENIKHVYAGANHVYKTEYPAEANSSIRILLDSNEVDVTLDLSVNLIQRIDLDLREHPRLFINASIQTPHLNTFKNITFKLDDFDFMGSNPGIWVFGIQDLPESSFNDWTVYSKDTIIKA